MPLPLNVRRHYAPTLPRTPDTDRSRSPPLGRPNLSVCILVQSMWTNLEHCRSSSTPAQPTYFSTPVPTVRKNILNVQADGRLAAHLRETPALKI